MGSSAPGICSDLGRSTLRVDGQRLRRRQDDRQTFLRDHNLISSMSRRGNCHDNAVAESFFQLLKRERIRRQVYTTRSDARADVFNYIEMFYNPKRRHGTAGDTSRVEFERRHSERLTGV